MDQESVIADIERQARDAGVSIQAVCVRARVHPTTFSRWKRSEKNPDPVAATLHNIGKLYSALAEIVAEKAAASGTDSHRLCVGAE